MNFTNAERELIAELRQQNAPIERWAKFFPNAKIGDIIRKPIGYYNGEPVYTRADIDAKKHCVVNNYTCVVGASPPQYALRMKKGNIYKWDSNQDVYLASCHKDGWSTQEIIEGIKRLFGIERTSGAITSRLCHLGLI